MTDRTDQTTPHDNGSTPRLPARTWWTIGALLALVVVAELFVEMHGHFGADETFGFNAWYGIVAAAVLIAGARFVGGALRRPEDYYDDDTPEDGA